MREIGKDLVHQQLRAVSGEEGDAERDDEPGTRRHAEETEARHPMEQHREQDKVRAERERGGDEDGGAPEIQTAESAGERKQQRRHADVRHPFVAATEMRDDEAEEFTGRERKRGGLAQRERPAAGLKDETAEREGQNGAEGEKDSRKGERGGNG